MAMKTVTFCSLTVIYSDINVMRMNIFRKLFIFPIYVEGDDVNNNLIGIDSIRVNTLK